jgi:hypothetical protein
MSLTELEQGVESQRIKKKNVLPRHWAHHYGYQFETIHRICWQICYLVSHPGRKKSKLFAPWALILPTLGLMEYIPQ